jgi:hypothetical protein
MKLLTIFFFLFSFSFSDKVYQRTTLNDIKVELSHDGGNTCISNITIQNTSNSEIKYSIKIWRGDIWYFKHQLVLKPGEVKYYNDAFITCDNKSTISVDLIKN